MKRLLALAMVRCDGAVPDSLHQRYRQQFFRTGTVLLGG